MSGVKLWLEGKGCVVSNILSPAPDIPKSSCHEPPMGLKVTAAYDKELSYHPAHILQIRGKYRVFQRNQLLNVRYLKILFWTSAFPNKTYPEGKSPKAKSRSRTISGIEIIRAHKTYTVWSRINPLSNCGPELQQQIRRVPVSLEARFTITFEIKLKLFNIPNQKMW